MQYYDPNKSRALWLVFQILMYLTYIKLSLLAFNMSISLSRAAQVFKQGTTNPHFLSCLSPCTNNHNY